MMTTVHEGMVSTLCASSFNVVIDYSDEERKEKFIHLDRKKAYAVGKKRYRRKSIRPRVSVHDSRISINSAIAEQCDHSPAPPDRNERITINVGGVRHETFRSTLRIYPDTRLGWIAVNGSDSIDAYDPIRNEYFFDRNPTVFTQIVNFYRTGKLHSPSDICGPLFEEELIYWGLDEKAMEPCCWSRYTEHRDAQENLKVFDNPDLNPVEEEPLPRFDQDSDNPLDGNSTFIQRIIKSMYPSCFKSEKWMHFKRSTWMLFEDRSSYNIHAKIFTIISLIAILLSVLSLCFHSMLEDAIKQSSSSNKTNNSNKESDQTNQLNKDKLELYSDLLLALDILTCIWMTIEFILRFISAPARISFMKQILNIVDLASILPYFALFYIRRKSTDVLVEGGPNSVKDKILIVSAIRLFRLLRFLRLSTGLEILQHTMIASGKEILLLLLLLAIPVIISATFVYHAEKELQGTKFNTIPKSIWWAIITMTTVGYGDMSPDTTVGMIFGAISASLSVVLLALPVSIIGNNFQLFYHYAQARLKLPKRPKNALVGAANALVAEPSQCSMSPELENDDSDNESVGSKSKVEGQVPEGYHSQNRRFQRDRLSLYSTSNSRYSVRRSKSMGTVPNEVATKTNGSAFPRRVSGHENAGLDNGGYDNENDMSETYNEKPLGRDNEIYLCRTNKFEESNIDENIPPDIVKKKHHATHKYYQENNNNVLPGESPKGSPLVPRTIVTVADNVDTHGSDNQSTGIIRRYLSPPVTRKYEESDMNKWQTAIPRTLSECDMADKDCNRQCNNFLCVP